MFVFVKQASLTLPTTSDFKPECTEVTWGGELEVAEETTWQRDQLSATHSHDQNTSAAVESQLSVTDAVGPIAQMAAKVGNGTSSCQDEVSIALTDAAVPTTISCVDTSAAPAMATARTDSAFVGSCDNGDESLDAATTGGNSGENRDIEATNLTGPVTEESPALDAVKQSGGETQQPDTDFGPAGLLLPWTATVVNSPFKKLNDRVATICEWVAPKARYRVIIRQDLEPSIASVATVGAAGSGHSKLLKLEHLRPLPHQQRTATEVAADMEIERQKSLSREISKTDIEKSDPKSECAGSAEPAPQQLRSAHSAFKAEGQHIESGEQAQVQRRILNWHLSQLTFRLRIMLV
eukprot:SAG31_NODE_886_length_11229_cov_19.134142_5_plen_351_part_00